MNYWTYLLILSRVLYKLLPILLYHLSYLLNLLIWWWIWSRRKVLRSWTCLNRWRRRITILKRTCQVYWLLHPFLLLLKHFIKFCNLLSSRHLTGRYDRTTILSLLIVNFLFFLFLKPFHILLLKSSNFRRWLSSISQLIFKQGMISQISRCLISLSNNLQIRCNFTPSSRIELVFNNTKQPLIKLKQGINLCLMIFASLSQFIQLIFTG